jgi:hypothetical protein
MLSEIIVEKQVADLAVARQRTNNSSERGALISKGGFGQFVAMLELPTLPV